MASAIEVFVRALVLAERDGAREITVGHLLGAMDAGEPAPAASEVPFVATPRRELPLSEAAQTALGNSDFEQLSSEALRAMLLAWRGKRNR